MPGDQLEAKEPKYSQDELVKLLGKPARRGAQPSSFGYWSVGDLTGLSQALRGEYLEWDCSGAGNDAYQCVAITIEEESPSRAWYVINACPQHERDLQITPFERVYDIPENVTPRTIAMTVADWESGMGSDFEDMTELLNIGWQFMHAGVVEKFPGYIFVTLGPPVQ